jgi:hypothetical protein
MAIYVQLFERTDDVNSLCPQLFEQTANFNYLCLHLFEQTSDANCLWLQLFEQMATLCSCSCSNKQLVSIFMFSAV